MKSKHVLPLLVAIAVAAPVLAQAPSTPGEVPTYPGAAEIAPPDDVLLETLGLSDFAVEQILEQGRTVWEVEAAPEDVLAWYRQRLDASELSDDAMPTLDASGRVEPFYVIMPYEIDRSGDSMVRSGEQIQRMLEAGGRRPIRPGTFVQYADLGWSVPTGPGEHTDFQLVLADATEEVGARPHRTTIDLQWSRYLVDQQAEEYAELEGDDQMEDAFAERRAEMGASGPSASELGVPIYPGSRFELDTSAGMSLGDDERYYVYISDDDPADVRAFYEERTGKTAQAMGEAAMIAVEGEGLMPSLGVMIQPTAGTPLEPMGRVIITVRRALD